MLVKRGMMLNRDSAFMVVQRIAWAFPETIAKELANDTPQDGIAKMMVEGGFVNYCKSILTRS